MISGLSFSAPMLLWALLALPPLFWLLRAVPPAAKRIQFPALRLLEGLASQDHENHRTPWWLLALRLCALGLVILGFAGPIWRAEEPLTSAQDTPLLLVLDAGWAQAPQWERTAAEVETALLAAPARPIALVPLSAPAAPLFGSAQTALDHLRSLAPASWPPQMALDWLEDLPQGPLETLWISDDLAYEGRSALAEALAARGPLTVRAQDGPLYGLRPAEFTPEGLEVTALRSEIISSETLEILGYGLDPAGVERVLLRESLSFEEGADVATLHLAPQTEIRNRLSRFEIAGEANAAAVALTDDRLRRRSVALIGSAAAQEHLTLLSPLHYLREALSEEADLFEGSLAQALARKPDVIVLADQLLSRTEESAALEAWIAEGGVLLRFAGPRLAADAERDPLLPVRLRAGGRSLDGALSWGTPKALAPFPAASPFAGLAVPADVSITRQVIAEPSAELESRVWAALEDGTPLVTRTAFDEGQIVLFHVTATPAWSTLPLSELFVQMLRRVTLSASGFTDESALEGTFWVQDQILSAQGDLTAPLSETPVAGEVLATGALSQSLPPGLYAGRSQRLALNVLGPESQFTPAQWPLEAKVITGARGAERPLKGWLLGAALALLLLDSVALAALSRGFKIAALLGILSVAAPSAEAQSLDPFAATRQVVLAHVATGEARIDETVAAGLAGLGQVLAARTTIVAGPPMAVDLETDELAFFPLLYWPITETTPLPSRAAYAKLNLYLQTGGMILFDTRDADLGAFGQTPASRRLQTLSLGLEIPALEPIPSDHILTRSFYILRSLAGRHESGDIWVQLSTPAQDETQVRGQNDDVTPVVIGANDWAAAWAMLADGRPMFPVGYGLAGEAQREAAYRFGVNLVMHVLTGNYKSDQVHVPELLERLRR